VERAERTENKKRPATAESPSAHKRVREAAWRGSLTDQKKHINLTVLFAPAEFAWNLNEQKCNQCAKRADSRNLTFRSGSFPTGFAVHGLEGGRALSTSVNRPASLQALQIDHSIDVGATATASRLYSVNLRRCQ
jgi:hypothetical protein